MITPTMIEGTASDSASDTKRPVTNGEVSRQLWIAVIGVGSAIVPCKIGTALNHWESWRSVLTSLVPVLGWGETSNEL